MTDISKRLSGLSSEKLKLLAQKLKEEKADGSASEIRRQPRDTNIYPLSFEQERLWFIDQLEPGDPAYNIAISYRCSDTPKNVSILERSLNEIIRRHDVMRASFPVVDGQPVQLIAPSLTLKPDLIDLMGLSGAEQEVEAERLARDEAKRPFDLAAGPLIRAKVLILDEADFVILVTMHHTISDGVSGIIFIQELTHLIDFFSEKELLRLPRLPIQYTDFAIWQREGLQREGLDLAVDYWKKQLGGISTLNLPTDRPKTSFGSGRGARDSVLLSDELVEALNELSRREGVTLFMTLLAAFKALLYKYCQQEDIVVGSPASGRSRKEIEKLIGLFVNMLVLRTKVEANASFTEMVRKEREVCLGAYAHQEIPFQRLVKELNPNRDLGRQPLFQVGFDLNNTPSRFQMQVGEDGVLPEGPAFLDSSRSMFDLAMTIDPLTNSRVFGKGGLKCILEYNRDLFEIKTCGRLLRHYKRTLETIVEDPGRRIADIDILGDEEKRLLLFEWNGVAAESAEDQCIHELFEEQVVKSPDRAAVVGEDQHLSYEELNRRANRLAHHLRGKGVGAEAIVALCLPRSPEMLISLLGVLKAGAAYLALDPTYPRERLAYMINDSQVRLVITGSRDAGLFDGQAAERLVIDQQWPEVAKQSPINPALTSTADNLAYVIYTSGSTGRPKGVMVAHRSLVNYTAAVIRSFGLTAADRMLQFASINFDVSAEEIYASLSSGATLELRSEEMLSSGRRFLEECERRQVSVMDLPTAYWHELSREMAEEELEAPASLRLLIVGGEKALIERLRQWRQRAGGRVRLINCYGPTETTVGVTMWETPRSEEASDLGMIREAPIGRSLANVLVYVVDETQALAPVGAHGELWIGGLAVARGYLGQASLTAEKFRPNPYSEAGSGRVYCSGDLGRYTNDGQLEFVGRKDEQIKIMGYRVEPGEIEAALREHEAIKECVVILKQPEQGEKRLVCYALRRDDREIDFTELRNYLRTKLPEYMAPSAFVLIDELPLTANGKIDRSALPEAEELALKPKEAYAPPCNEAEQIIAGIWEEILAGQRIVDRIGVNDNFFDLGGHSLLMIKLQSRLREVFERKITVVELFQHPTIRGLAKHLGGEREEGEAVTKGEDRAAIRKKLSRQAKQYKRAN